MASNVFTVGSFDIGERNFAFCVGTEHDVTKWCLYDVVVKSQQTVIESCQRISQLLEDHDWIECDHIVIEQQMRGNIRAQRVAQHVWTWFSLKYPTIPVSLVAANSKLDYYGQRKCTYSERKKWSVDKTLNILRDRNDNAHVAFLQQHRKKNDLADAFLQLLVFCKKRSHPPSSV